MTVDLNRPLDPFVRPPGADANEIAARFLQWAHDALLEIHEYERGHAVYLKAIWERMNAISGTAVPAPPAAPFPVGGAMRDTLVRHSGDLLDVLLEAVKGRVRRGR